jgi:hypothetical protein
MSDQLEMFDICAGYHGGDECSQEANSITWKSRDRLKIIIYLRGVIDATCDEVEIALGMRHQTCSARFADLKREGILVFTSKRPTRTGCMAKAWALKIYEPSR